jgi:hypothetical protein
MKSKNCSIRRISSGYHVKKDKMGVTCSTNEGNEKYWISGSDSDDYGKSANFWVEALYNLA